MIDTWVWQKAAESDLTCLNLLTTLFYKCKHTILCDLKGDIEEEYLKYLKRSILQKLFFEMAKKGKIEKKNRSRIPNNFQFDPDDMKFLEVAILLDAVVISGDSDFLTLREKLQSNTVLKSQLRNVRIITPSEAIDSLI